MAKTDHTGSLPPLDWCVVGTLAWFGTLGRPLQLSEIRRLLLLRTATEAEIRDALGQLDDKIVERDGFYSPKGLKVRYPEPDTERWFRYKWWRARLAASVLGWIPYIELVTIANTLADRTASKESDIDVFIVTKDTRLFTVRTLSVIYLQLAGLRRHGKKINNRVCLTFYVTDKRRDLSDIAFKPYDIYLAYWMAGLTPLLAEPGAMGKLLKANSWAAKLVPEYAAPRQPAPKPGWPASLGLLVFGNPFGDLVEKTAKKFWLKRIDTSPRTEEPDVQIIADDSMLKFHEKERRKIYRTEWEHTMERLGYDPKLIQRRSNK
jgi:hypothetical protein